MNVCVGCLSLCEKFLTPHFFKFFLGCLLSHSNLLSTTLSTPLCFLNKNYSVQKAALVDLTIQELVTHACGHVCFCTQILTHSGSRTDHRSRHRHGISTLTNSTISAPPFSSYIQYLPNILAPAAILQRPDSRTNDCNDSSFRCNTKAIATLLAVYGVWYNGLQNDSIFLESCICK